MFNYKVYLMSKENEEILIKFVGTVRLEKNRYVITIPKQSAEALTFISHENIWLMCIENY